MKGQIVKIMSDTHVVSYEGKQLACKCRGKFRNDKITPLVGDYVKFNIEKALIEEILPRKNEFIRPLVSNIDQALLVTSVKEPDFSANLLDKLILVMELNNVEPIVCFTKEDLLKGREKKEIKQIKKYYQKLGYKVLTNTKLGKIKKIFKNKSSVFTGQTGAGKSSLINKLDKTLNLQTGEISKALGRGKHTTRTVELMEYGGGKIFDTPGFSSLDFKDISKDKFKEGFIEFAKYPCPYKDCNHLQEKECSVKQAVKNDKIMTSRYETYEKLMK